jgi:hypothetical protein
LVTRIVDQIPPENFGRAKIPDEFPKGSPVFKLTYQRGANSRGFFSSEKKKYAVVSALIDFTY